MEKFEHWINEIIGFQIDENILHLYIGTPHDPRSTMVKIDDTTIKSPKRMPPTSKSLLTKRYEGKKLGKFPIKPKIKYILGILRLLDIDFVTTKTESDGVVVKDFPSFSYDEKLDVYPITDEIRSWILHGTNLPDEVIQFLYILGKSHSRSRQHALTKLLRSKSDTAHSLLILLFGSRVELTASIIREYGRQNISSKFILSYCEQEFIELENPLQKYCYYYLLSFNSKIVKDKLLHLETKLSTEKFFDKSRQTRVNQILYNLGKNKISASRSFHNYILYFDETDILLDDFRMFFNQFEQTKYDAEFIRTAIMSIVKFVEIVDSSILAAFALAWSHCGLSWEWKNDFELNDSTYNFELKYVRRRLSSLIEVWQNQERDEILQNTIALYLSLMPKEEILSLSEYKEQNGEILTLFATKHPVLSMFGKDIGKWFEGPYRHEILTRCAQIEHFVIKDIIEDLISPNSIDFSNLSNVKLIYIAKFFPEKFDINDLINNTVVEITNINQLEINTDLFDYFIENNLIFSSKLFQQTLSIHLEEPMFTIEQFKGMIRQVSGHSDEMLENYFETISDQITPELIQRIDEHHIKQFLIEVVIEWSNITGKYPSEQVQDLITSLKIILQDDLEEFDLESSKPMSVETITTCYFLTGGEIPKFVETNIQFSFTKPVWDQLARHYLALGLQRPKRKSIGKSKLKDVPNYITRDVLGQIALINQTLSYCERNGFREPLENLIIQNIYKRGWNVERRLERTVPSLFGVLSPRLRSYFAAYLVVEQGEVSLSVLKLARDVEDYLVRDRILRELDRYGTQDMWQTLAEAYHPDIRTRALEQIKDSRLSPQQRSKTTVNLILSTKGDARKIGLNWLEAKGVQHDDMQHLLVSPHQDTWGPILDYIRENREHLNTDTEVYLHDLILKILWSPKTKRILRQKSIDCIDIITKDELKQSLLSNISELSNVKIRARRADAINAASILEESK